MLKELRIKNIILIESAEISFSDGFNVLSGETGSGKTAIIEALNLVTGSRADIHLIRKDADRGMIEAVFDIQSIPDLRNLLHDAGIDHDDSEELIIRRELHSTGKSRAFINNQQAHLSLLRELGKQLLDIVGQHANQSLLNSEQHRVILDLFGGLQNEVNVFSKHWQKEVVLRRELEELKANESQRLRDIEVCRMELQELEEANLKEGEEEKLFAEYSKLVNREEIAQKIHAIQNSAVISELMQTQTVFDQLVELDTTLSDTAESYRNALIELQEVSHSLTHYYSSIEFTPERLQELNDRLALINRLKRKYGSTVEEIRAYQEKISEKLKQLESSDIQIEKLEKELNAVEKTTHDLAKKLSKNRKQVAKTLEKAIVNHLHELNMPKAEFFVEFQPRQRNHIGDDAIEFFLKPNVGERKIPIKECASGGELSRLMLAIQTLLSGKEQKPTLIFDEIDANIGGETATVVGEKLKKIGKKHQVLCITHFPQVAQHAQHHFQISKREENGRTLTFVEPLDKQTREKELARMAGIN